MENYSIMNTIWGIWLIWQMQKQKFFTGLLKRNLLYSEYILCSQPFQSNVQRHINHTRYWWIKGPFRHHIVTKLTKCKKKEEKKKRKKHIAFSWKYIYCECRLLDSMKNVTEMLANTSNVTQLMDGYTESVAPVLLFSIHFCSEVKDTSHLLRLVFSNTTWTWKTLMNNGFYVSRLLMDT